MELPYYSVDYYAIAYIYCGVGGKQRASNKSVEHYPQCKRCEGKLTALRRKRKIIVEGDFKKMKKVHNQLINV